MSVDIDQAGETRGTRKINRGDPIRELRRRRGADRGDRARSIEDHGLVDKHLTGANIE